MLLSKHVSNDSPMLNLWFGHRSNPVHARVRKATVQTHGLASRPRAVCRSEGARGLEHRLQLPPLVQGHDAWAVIAAADRLAVDEYVGH